MLPVHPANKFTCPFMTRLGSWQARHICPLELSFTRNFCATVSTACACGLWQLMHSTLPLISLICPVGSAVFCCGTSVATRSAESFIGKTRLNGCDVVR